MAMPGAAIGNLTFPDPATFPGFPLKTVIEMEQHGMNIIQTIEAEVEFGVQIDGDRFEIPEGYERMPGLPSAPTSPGN